MYEVALPLSGSSPARARRLVAAATESRWPAQSQAAALVVSELVTNSLRYTTAPVTLGIELRDAVLHVEVTDDGPGSPTPARPSITSTHGRGLLIVTALADRWGVVPHPVRGKTVWFEIDLGAL